MITPAVYRQSAGFSNMPAVFQPSAPYQILLAQTPTPTPGSTPGGNSSATGSTAATGTSANVATNSNGMMVGAININTASLDVLQALPQMTSDVANDIINYRGSTPFVSRGDILQVTSVTPAIFNAIVENISSMSDTFTVRSLGISQVLRGSGQRTTDVAVHLTAIIDRTTGKCRVVRLKQDN